MTKQVAYMGFEDLRVLSQEDLRKADENIVLEEPLSFRRGIYTEVADNVAEALMSQLLLFGQFILLDVELPPADPAGVDEPTIEPEPIDIPAEGQAPANAKAPRTRKG